MKTEIRVFFHFPFVIAGNYNVSPHVAEFYNTISNLPFVIGSAIAMYLSWPYIPLIGWGPFAVCNFTFHPESTSQCRTLWFCFSWVLIIFLVFDNCTHRHMHYFSLLVWDQCISTQLFRLPGKWWMSGRSFGLSCCVFMLTCHKIIIRMSFVRLIRTKSF